MSHLTSRRSVRITPGGSAAAPVVPAGEHVPPNTSWTGLIADLAAALGLSPNTAVDFARKVDDVVDAVTGTGDIEVARTRVRAALLGNVGMLSERHDIDLSEHAVNQLLADTIEGDSTVEDRVLARLALLHDGLVVPDLPPGHDDTVGEGSGGSAAPLPETDPEPDNTVGQVAYTLDSVPHGARQAAAWIEDAHNDDDRRARAQAALEVEEQRPPSERRSTVTKAIAGVLDG